MARADHVWPLFFANQDLNGLELYKLGTGSYSEVFKMSDNSVLKVCVFGVVGVVAVILISSSWQVCPFVLPAQKELDSAAKIPVKLKGPPVGDILAEVCYGLATKVIFL